jgi:Tfp pilus assembly protein PilF
MSRRKPQPKRPAGAGSAASAATASTESARRGEAAAKAASASGAIERTGARTRPWMLAAAVFVLALLVRGLHLWQLRRAPFLPLLMGDSLSYDLWAQRIANGEWLGREVFYQAPLYPYLLGALYACVGHDPMAARMVQIVLGSLACAMVAIGGTRLFGPRAGGIGGVLLAICGPAIFFDGLIQKATLDVLLCSVLLLCVAWLVERVTFARALGAGLTLGALALTRENALVLLPALLAWLAWCVWSRDICDARETRAMSVWLPLIALPLGVALMLAPVAIRNFAVGGELHLTTAQSGPNFYIGNHDGASGTYEPLRPARGNAAYERQDAIDLAQQALGRTLTPGEVSSYWWQRGWQWIAAHPTAWLTLTAKKLLLTWNAEEATDTEDLYSHAEWSLPLKLAATLVHFGVLAPLAVLGIWLTRSRWRELWGLYAMLAVYTVSVASFFVLARYRYPLVPFLALFAGAAIAQLPALWRSSASAASAANAATATINATAAREKWQAAIVLVLAAIVCNWPLLPAAEMRAVTHYNIGYEFQMRGQNDDAMAEYRTALALVPGYALAHSNLGVLLAARGERDEARTQYREASRLDPTLAEPLVNLGIDLAQAGDHAAAIDTLQRAITLDPTQANAHYNLGTALASVNRLDDARREFERTLALDPTNAAAHNNLGILFASTGHPAEGIQHFRAALTLRPDYAEAAANLQRAQAMVR